MRINFVDTDCHLEFAPLSLLKPVSKLWMGCFTFEGRWKFFLENATFGYETVDYLQKVFLAHTTPDLRLAANLIADKELVEFLKQMPEGNLFYQSKWIAQKGNSQTAQEYSKPLEFIEKRWELFTKNAPILKSDFQTLTVNRKSASISSTNQIIGDTNLVFFEEGARAEAAILNTNDGPIYVSKNAEIMEGSLIRGGLFLGEGAALKMGAKLYGANTIAPFSKVGGELGNSVIQSYSNKGHDGYLGNALIGEWCNLGADTNSSNLKNNYGFVRTYSYATKSMVDTGEQFMGLCMGDHSKCGINTMFNTATVVGICANIYGGDFPDKFIPSFAWGGQQWEKFQFVKAIEAANNMMIRRSKSLTEEDIAIWHYLYDTL